MGLLNSLINSFSKTPTSLSERVTTLEIKTVCLGKELPDLEHLILIKDRFPRREKIKISIENETLEEIIQIADIPNFQQYQNFKNKFFDDELEVMITIDKKVEDNKFSIYCFDNFMSDFLKKETSDIMKAFNQLLKLNNYLIFEIFDSSLVPSLLLSTETMVFKKADEENTILESDRLKKIETCKQNSNFYSNSNLELIPEDFHIKTDSNSNLRNVFEKIETLLSIAYLSNSAFLEKSSFKIQISGHRMSNYECDINVQKLKNKEFYEIYKWTYTDGNPADKLIIARNAISLHCKNLDLINIDETVFASIKSNFALYQKENVMQYIDLKNKLAEYIVKLTTTSNDMIYGLFDKFKNNLIAFLTFLLSVYLIKIMSNQSVGSVFTKDVTYLSFLILVASFLFMIIGIAEVYFQKNKIVNGYNELKKNYEDILDKKDIENTFKSDDLLKKSI
ncbi:hypothetical protein [Methanolapillus millepedarum]|uniref:Uncharacterized protein n=1 Tax=Methanolapillus millepedarum TaxID=3028296 RepID=A0AA96ZVD3_9EURY|nr:hypothetical protein MsAc7_02510 [Methanosarcinaceae archaeon Ac7]